MVRGGHVDPHNYSKRTGASIAVCTDWLPHNFCSDGLAAGLRFIRFTPRITFGRNLTCAFKILHAPAGDSAMPVLSA